MILLFQKSSVQQLVLLFCLLKLILVFFAADRNTINFFPATEAARIVRVFEDPYPYYISRLKYYKKIPDNATLNFFGFEYESLQLVSKSLLSAYREEEPVQPVVIPDVKETDSSCTDYDNDSVEKFRLLQDNDQLLSNVHYLVPMCNPSVTYFQGKYLLAGRNRNYKPIVYFAWLNRAEDNVYSVNEKDVFHGVGPGITEIAGFRLSGEDPRLVVLDENTFAVIANMKIFPGRTPLGYVCRTIVSYVGVKADTKSLYLINETLMQPVRSHDNEKWDRDEKNWTPFIFKGALHFITSHQDTLEVIRQVPGQADRTEVVSTTNIQHINWDYGSMRGGSPARLLGKDRYFGFFHSTLSNRFCSRWREYYFGAYILSAELPFTLQSVSKVPIYHPSFYTGDYERNWGVEYVYFPMDFFFVHLSTGEIVNEIEAETCDTSCLAGYNLTLSFGAQDKDGYIGTMNMLELYHTLTHYHHNE